MTKVITYSINGKFLEEGVLYPTGQYRLLRSAGKDQSATTLSSMGSEGGGGFPDEPTFPGIPTFPGTPTPGNPNQYSESEATMIIDQLSNPITGEGIELYLVANYRGSKQLNLSVFSVAGNAVSAGSYSLTPHYTANGTLLFYAAFRNSTNGIEYIVKASDLQKFRSKITYYTAAADLVYLNGVPTSSQVRLMSGDYLNGLVNMWSEALRSPSYYAYLAHVLFGIGTNLEPANIQYTSITIRNTNKPNYRIDNMSYQQYKNAISDKFGPWQPTSTVGVENITNGSYRWTARPNASEWEYGLTIDYYKVSTGETIAKIRFTQ